MKLLTLGVLGYAIKNYLGDFKNSIIDSVDSEMKRTKSEIDTNTKKIVSTGNTSAVEQVTKAVKSAVESASQPWLAEGYEDSEYYYRDLQRAKQLGFKTASEYRTYIEHMGDAK